MNKVEMLREVKSYYVAMQLNEVLPAEVYELYVKPNFNTASWRYYNGVHKIVIGEDIYENFNKQRSHKQDRKYLRAFLNHEFSHSIWTHKDVDEIASILKKEKMAFSLFNLFEDARIEEKMRRYIKKKFDWLDYEHRCFPSSPVESFYFIVQCEHASEVLEEYKYVDEFKIVFQFYKKVLACKNSFEVIEILREWYAKYPQTREDIKDLEHINYLFIAESRTQSDLEFETLLVDCVSVLEILGGEEGSTTHSSISIDSTIEGSLLHSYTMKSAYDLKDRDLLIQEMKKHFMKPKRYGATEFPSKRLNVKRMGTGSKKLFKRKEQMREYKHKVNIILDLSGSMAYTIHNMRLIVDVLNTMVEKDLLEVNLILTGVTMEGAMYEVIPMPLPEDTIERIVAIYWGEGLDNCLKSNMPLLQKADYNWILTDGYIDEKPLDKEFYSRAGVSTYAMYIGNSVNEEQMKKSFDYVICEKDVLSLTRKIFMFFKGS